MSKIFFDLDGTLLDAKVRLYTLFCALTEQKELTFERYWDLKKAKIDHPAILTEYFSYSAALIQQFQKDWLNLIETNDYLDMDKPFLYTDKVLESLAQSHQLYVVTARQGKEGVIHQLNNHNLTGYFEEILVTEGKKTKAELIIGAVGHLSGTDMLAGDTGLDILTAKEMGCRSLAVLSGFRNREVLAAYQPDFLEENITAIIQYV